MARVSAVAAVHTAVEVPFAVGVSQWSGSLMLFTSLLLLDYLLLLVSLFWLTFLLLMVSPSVLASLL